MKRQVASDLHLEIHQQLFQGERLIPRACAQLDAAAAEAERKVRQRRGLAAMVGATERIPLYDDELLDISRKKGCNHGN